MTIDYIVIHMLVFLILLFIVDMCEFSVFVYFVVFFFFIFLFFFQAEDGIRDLVRSRGLGDVYKRQNQMRSMKFIVN